LDVEAGWIFLQDGPEGPLTLAASKGLPEACLRDEAERDLGNGICRQVMDSGEARIFSDDFACLRRNCRVLEQEGLRCRASIPLKAKDRVLGIMNLACVGGRTFQQEDLQFLSSLGNQIGIAIENASLYEEVEQKEVQRRRLLDKLIGAQEEERKRIARELHDQVGQSLTALIMGLGTVEEMVGSEAEQVKSQVAGIRAQSATILEEIRRLMIDLRPALLDDLGLIPAVRSFAETDLARARVQSHVQVVGAKRKLPASMEIAVFRVIQEAVTNIIKHAEARNATVELCFRHSSIGASIEDDGKGFDRTQLGRNAHALGLLGMRERVTLLGGTWRIESRPGRGTRVAVDIPTPSVAPDTPASIDSRAGRVERLDPHVAENL
jgi:signal transduction histidine kinase